MWVRGSRAREAESDSLIAMNARALRWLGGWFGIPYAFGKFDFLLAPAFPFGAWSILARCSTTKSVHLSRAPHRHAVACRQATVYHEVAHQWFGDYMTMRWFDDLWLKEGSRPTWRRRCRRRSIHHRMPGRHSTAQQARRVRDGCDRRHDAGVAGTRQPGSGEEQLRTDRVQQGTASCDS